MAARPRATIEDGVQFHRDAQEGYFREPEDVLFIGLL